MRRLPSVREMTLKLVCVFFFSNSSFGILLRMPRGNSVTKWPKRSSYVQEEFSQVIQKRILNTSSAVLKTNLPYYHVLEKWQTFLITVIIMNLL